MGFGVYFEITNACHLRCNTCLPASAKPRSGELKTLEIIEILERLKNNGAESVFFTGGEPFIHPDFLFILEKVANLGFHISIVTSGTLLDMRSIALLKKYNVEVTISLDGACSETNDKIRGKGVFKKAVRSIDRLVKVGLKVTLGVTVTRHNFDEMEKLALLAQQMGCSKILYNEVVQGGRASDNWDDLLLTNDHRALLPQVIKKVAKNIFSDETCGFDDRCWVDGSALYINSIGMAYLCSEIFQREPDFAIASITSEAGIHSIIEKMQVNHGHRQCCYQTIATEHVMLISNLDKPCALVQLGKNKLATPIQTIDELKRDIDELWSGIDRSCANCNDPDCLGYIWVMPKEEDLLLDVGVEIVQVNEPYGPIFIDSYPRDEHGHIIVNHSKSHCPYLDRSGRCSIHSVRPLTCHLYPLGPETLPDGRIVWALHVDCFHVRSIKQSGGQEFLITKIRQLLKRISPELRKEIRDVYEKVDEISVFPDGPNNFITLEEI